jgi:hypothetical protein
MKSTSSFARPAEKQQYLFNNRKLLIMACAIFICSSTISLSAYAQTLFGSMVGTVTDSSGAAVAGATVTIVSSETNDMRTAQTSDNGLYTLSTLSVGTYKVTITKAGFDASTAPAVSITANNVQRIDGHLHVGNVTETVEVHTDTVQLQTDTAEVHSELSAQSLQDLPQPSRTYEGVLNTVPGVTPPGGQLAGGTNNPSKSMQFSANGTGTSGPNVRIEGVSATNQWQQQYTTFVPSSEAIQSVNVVTNSPDAEQGLSGGPAVTVQLKSGSNGIHGSAYIYNINNFGEARAWLQPAGQKPIHVVDNDAA